MIVTGDARHLPLEDNTVRLVVTSPPYFGLRTYTDDGNEIGREPSIDGYVKALIDVLDELWRVVTPDGNVFLNLGDRTAGNQTYRNFTNEPDKPRSSQSMSVPLSTTVEGRKGSLVGLPYRVALEALERGWVLRSEIVWRKLNPIPDHSTTRRPMRTHELVVQLTKTHQNFVRSTEGDRPLHSVWNIGSEPLKLPNKFTHHTAAMPTELARIIIDRWSHRDDVVLDPFGGTGTTALVADVLARRWISNDLDPECAQITGWRIRNPASRRRVMNRHQAVTDRDGSQGACRVCGTSLAGYRTDARFCSGRCRQSAHRNR